MPYKKYVFRKLLRKLFFTVFLIPVFLINLICKLSQILCRFVLLPVSLVAGAAGLIFMFSTKAFDETAISLVVLCIFAAIATYILPCITSYFDEVLNFLIYDLSQPIIPKPPARYRYN